VQSAAPLSVPAGSTLVIRASGIHLDALSGEVVNKRKKKLSKKYYGTSHVLSKDEAKFVFESGCEQLILGTGQMGNVHLSPEAEAYFAKTIAVHPRGDPCVQQVAGKEDRAFSRDLLKRTSAGRDSAAADKRSVWECRAPGRGRLRNNNPRDRRRSPMSPSLRQRHRARLA
jgi:hypothetical protein